MFKLRPSTRAVVLAALMLFFGLQSFRVFLPKVIWYLGEYIGAEQQALLALGIFATAWLVPLLRRWLGERRLLVLTIGGTALIFLGFQLARSALAYLLLASAGILLWVWFIPLWLTSLRSRTEPAGLPSFAAGLPLAFLLDTLLRGLFWGYDLAWQHTPLSFLLSLLIAGGAAAVLAAELRDCPPDYPAQEAGLSGALPLFGIGPFLYLGMATLHNGAALAVAGGYGDTAAYGLAGVNAAAGLAAALLCTRMTARGRRLAMFVNGLVLLAALWLLYSRLGSAWPLAGVVALVAALAAWSIVGMLLTTTAHPRQLRPGMWKTAAATFLALVMMLLILFMIAQFEMYWMLILAGALTWLAGLWAVLAGPAEQPRQLAGARGIYAAAGVGLVIMLAWAGLEQSLPDQPAPKAGETLRVMTYNIHQGINADLVVDLPAIADAIAAENPDIIALNEVNRARATNGFVDVLPMISQRLGMPYVFGANYADGQYGNAVLSRYPVIEWSNTHYQTNTTEVRGVLRVVVMAPSGPVTVFATHLDHIGSPNNARAAQVGEILALWNNQPSTLIVGDLNAAPKDPELSALYRQTLTDVLAATGQDDVNTFWGEDRRIDYIFITPDFTVNRAWVPQTRASDHLPVVAEIAR